MTSPDVSKYTDLTIHDEKVSTSLQTILQAARGFLPSWVPQTGQIEVVLSEAIAKRSAEVSHAINRVPGATVETLLELFGITLSEGVQATATVKVTAYGNFTLPVGSEMVYIDTGNNTSYIFTTGSSVTLSPVKATGKLTLAGCTANTTYPAGTQFTVTVGSTTYTYTSDSSFATDGSGNTASVTVTATVFGKDHNDVTHGGVIPNGSNAFEFSGSSGGGATVTAQTGDTNGFINGSDDNATVTVTAQNPTSQYNISALGSELSLLNSAANFKEAVFTTNPTGGKSRESDTDYFQRGVSTLSGYSGASSTSSQILNYISDNKSYAERVAVYNRRRYRDRDTTAADYGLHNGHVLVAVGGFVGSQASATTELPVSSANLAELHTTLTDRVPASLSVDVMTAELADVDITASVVKESGTTASTVKTAIETALKAYLDTSQWNWNDTLVRRNEIISTIDAVTGVDYVSSLTMSGSTLIGTNNIGYNNSTGGAKATIQADLAGLGAGADYTAGTCNFYYIDLTASTPYVYEFANAAFDADTGSSTTKDNVVFTAVANGVNYNSSGNGGKTSTTEADWKPIDVAGASFSNIDSATGASGGVDDTTQFVALSGSTFVSTDLVLRNLGTLVTFGTLSITVT